MNKIFFEKPNGDRIMLRLPHIPQVGEVHHTNHDCQPPWETHFIVFLGEGF
jgi:hypothetical protein